MKRPMLGLLIALMAVFACASCLFESDSRDTFESYLPLKVGNYWVYDEYDGDGTRQATVRYELVAQHEGWFVIAATRQSSSGSDYDDDRICRFDATGLRVSEWGYEGENHYLLRRTMKSREKWCYSDDSELSCTELVNADTAVVVKAGRFKHVAKARIDYYLDSDTPEAVVFSNSTYFARRIGPVREEFRDFWNDESGYLELVSYHVK